MTDADDTTIDDAYAWLRSATTADLRFDEHIRPIKYIIAPDGRLVAPVMVAALQSVDTVLFVPEYAEGAMEVQVSLEELDESSKDGRFVDRWRIHHGEPEDVRWAWMTIDCARLGGNFIDGEVLVRENPLADDEARLCRTVNQQHADDLRLLCKRFADAEVEQPLMVAIDPGGYDIRRRFDVLRVQATEPMPTAEAAERVLGKMIDEARRVHDDGGRA